MTAEGEIRRAQLSFVQGTIDLEELERRVWDALTGKCSPTSNLAAILKEQWTDAPGSIDVYWPVA